jgi:nucleoside phosphorylase
MIILSALKPEVFPLIRALNAEYVVSYNRYGRLYRSGDCDILITGVGPAAATKTFRQYLKTQKPKTAINLGTAGILGPDIGILDVCPVSVSIAANDPRQFILSAEGRICISCQEPLSSAKEREKIVEQTAAGIADMELFALADIAAAENIALSAIKVATDPADESSKTIYLRHVHEAALLLRDHMLEKLKQE